MIKATVGEQKTQKVKDFPKLMKLSSTKKVIFLFETSSNCTCLYSEHPDWGVGEHCADLNIDIFEDFNEPITLQNQ